MVTEIISWWYSAGWRTFIAHTRARLTNLADFFSMSSLVRTLFQPYRQIAATATTTSKSQAFLDRSVSRLIGFFARLVLLITGALAIAITSIISLIIIVFWPLAPIFPLIGLILTFSGFMMI